MGNDLQGKVHEELRAGMGHWDARAAALWRYDKLSHVCYDKLSHLPNCLCWLCFAPVAENVPGKNSGRFWENFLYDKRLPWADRQVWVRVCMPLAWSGHMDGSHQNVPVKNLRRFWEDFLMRNYRQGEAHAKIVRWHRDTGMPARPADAPARAGGANVPAHGAPHPGSKKRGGKARRAHGLPMLSDRTQDPAQLATAGRPDNAPHLARQQRHGGRRHHRHAARIATGATRKRMQANHAPVASRQPLAIAHPRRRQTACAAVRPRPQCRLHRWRFMAWQAAP